MASSPSSPYLTLPYNLPAIPTFLTLTTLLALAIPSLLYPTATLRWLRVKRYQYEVTLPLYMMTPMERFIFNSLLFLTLSMILIACALYLPEHIATISRRAAYYYNGFHSWETTSGSGVTSQHVVYQDGGVGQGLKTVVQAGAHATRAVAEAGGRS